MILGCAAVIAALFLLLFLNACAGPDNPDTGGASSGGGSALSSAPEECRRLAATACSFAASYGPPCGACELTARCEPDQEQADPRLADCEDAIVTMPDAERCGPDGLPRWPVLCSLVFP